MKKYMYLHVGFTKPTEEMMEQWKKWFESISHVQTDQQGFASGREISQNGTRELSWDHECFTGYNIIEAESMDEAEKLAKTNPFVSSIRIYELR